MKVPPRQIASFLSAIPKDINAVLLHGNDLGLISERARQIALHISSDLDDVFSVTRIDGDRAAADPSIISDSAQAIAMTADRRLVWVKGKGSEMLTACKNAFAQNIEAAFIIIEASDTTTRHALVKLFETTQHAASIGCYADNAADLGAVLREITSRDNITLDQDTASLVVQRLGSDRAASRQEIEKLALLAGPGGTLTYDDVAMALGDSGLLATTDIAIAAADGQVDALQRRLEKAWSESQNPIMVLRGCQSYFRQLLIVARAAAGGVPMAQAIKSLRPPVHFRLQDRMVSQLAGWSTEGLFDAVNRLQDAELAIKSGGSDDMTQAGQALLGICLRRKVARR